MFPDWNFIRKPTLAAAAIAVLASTLLSAQSARQSPLLRQGLQALETGDTLKALQAWEQAEDPGYAIARYYLHLAATLKLKDHYDKATRLFYRELNGSFDLPAGKQAFEKDLLYLKLLMTPEEFENRFGKKTEREIPQAVRLFWENADPLPTSPANPRLIEHYARVAEALNRFPDESSPLGFDDRGKLWVRYGEPDKTFDGKTSLDRGAIMNFVSDFFFLVDNSGLPCTNALAGMQSGGSDNSGGSEGGGSNKSVDVMTLTNVVESDIISRTGFNDFQIWGYNSDPWNGQSNFFLYFEGDKGNTYSQVNALEDLFSTSMFTTNQFDCRLANLKTGLVAQYILYQELIGFDIYFANRFQEIDSEIFSRSAVLSESGVLNLAQTVKIKNRIEAFRNRASAPEQSSTEEKKIPSIPMQVYQYRLLDEQGNPVLATFVESRPSAAFLTDLTANQDKMVPETEHVIAEELSRWYTLRQDVDLRDESGRLTGRLRSLPELPLDEQDRVPATSLFTIPHLPEATTQHFYVTLENHHPGTKPPEESVFPDELRGLGRVQLPQPEPLDLNGEGPVLGDLLIGYGRMEHTESGLKFPFVVSHDRTIPEGENLAVHFEAYRLQTNRQGFANFEVRYEIEPRQGLIGRLLANRDELSGTLSFEPRATRFSESLEFEELSLEPGHYTLHWTVRDLLIGEQAGQSVEFEVVEPK